jgi:hypothetical protein
MEKAKEILKSKKSRCKYPLKLKNNPQDCSPEQIKECHPKAKSHPCTGKVTRSSKKSED